VRFASRGDYDVRFTDPGQRGAQLVIARNGNTAFAASHALLPATLVTVRIGDGSAFLANTLVQVRCASCTGLDRERAIAEGVTGVDGRVTLAVPRP
jgi:hypothetical protein